MVEDEPHVFFVCATARASWEATRLLSVLQNVAYQQVSAADRVFAMCRAEERDTVGRIAALLWWLWHNRNDKV
ncbi:hypothetical protein A2U01_0062188 [Trifolium medium]|uniref:Uncharacterized protein n=1 Tax=Trifolium medium TaxID=97028 RepID=A0A392RZA1_9FABA|nr:hypothetical protein [Trifolium medium]